MRATHQGRRRGPTAATARTARCHRTLEAYA
jgi:hypothetical protein